MLSGTWINYTTRWLMTCGLLLAAFTCGSLVAQAQDNSTQTPVSPPAQQTPTTDEEGDDPAGETAVVEPVFKDYKGVTIGMDASEARRKLGDEDAKGKTSDFFRISDNEMVQLYYDASSKVRAISIMYLGKDSNAPQAKDVLGETLEPGSDGRVYKLIRYPQARYWVAYSRTAGDSPTVSITMQRMRAVK